MRLSNEYYKSKNFQRLKISYEFSKILRFDSQVYQAASSITPYVTQYLDVPLDHGVYIYYVHGAGMAVGVVIGVKLFKPLLTR